MSGQPDPFLRVPLTDGGTWIRIDRLFDGRVMCQLCFGYFPTAELAPVPGGVEDVCRPCKADEEQTLLSRLPAGDA